ncbi:MAG TPA: penicillin-binding protein 2 [Bacillota bacterium]|nr:penicillin-binding protein 2 [Bacillota bacterium]
MKADSQREGVRRRLVFLQAFLAILLLILLARSAHLQLLMGEYYQELARGNALRLVRVPAPRGRVFDRHGRLLAGNRPAFSISLVHPGTAEVDATIETLAPLVGMTVAEIQEAVRRHGDRLFEPVRLQLDIDPATHSRVEESRADLPGVIVETGPVRHYPYGELASHLLGFVGEIDPWELDLLEGYRLGDILGKTGIEAVLDRELRGRDGGSQVETDARHRPIRVLGQLDPIPGHDVFLTIDAELQKVVEQSLADTMAAVRAHPVNPYRATSGAAVVLKVDTGEILAMVSYPGFDPNQFASRMPADYLQALRADPLSPFLNRVTSGLYSPGSAFKMVTAIAALESGRVTPDETVVCTGIFRVTPGHVKRCWRPGGHGPVNIRQAIAVSCNSFFYEMARRVGVDLIAYHARALGLGYSTGIELRPSDKPGTVPDRAWKRARFPHDPTFWLAEELDAAIGQGFHQYTPLQMAVYVAALANGGARYQPYVMSRIVDPASGRTVRENLPRLTHRTAISPETLSIVREGMQLTTTGGTAAWQFGPTFRQRHGFDVAGKTGTAEAPPASGRDHYAWFVAFAPADNPTIAIAVVVEEGGSGSLAAAPVARAIIDHYFQLTSDAPELPRDLPPGAGD